MYTVDSLQPPLHCSILGQDTEVTPLLFTRSAMGFLMTTESQNLGLTSHPKDCTSFDRMNEWCIYIALSLCIAVHPKRFTIMGGGGVSPQPPPVCSIHLDDATAATGQRRQCTHHTPATGGEQRESLSQSSGRGLLGGHDWQEPVVGIWPGYRGYTPTLLREVPWDF